MKKYRLIDIFKAFGGLHYVRYKGMIEFHIRLSMYFMALSTVASPTSIATYEKITKLNYK